MRVADARNGAKLWQGAQHLCPLGWGAGVSFARFNCATGAPMLFWRAGYFLLTASFVRPNIRLPRLLQYRWLDALPTPPTSCLTIKRGD